MVISPQLGQENFVASLPGAISLWHDVHMGMGTVTAAFSVMVGSFYEGLRYIEVLLICTLLCKKLLVLMFG